MKPTSQWSIRRTQCPEGRGQAKLLVEWSIEKGKKILRGLSCDNSHLADYSGTDCQWHCLAKMSGKKKF